LTVLSNSQATELKNNHCCKEFADCFNINCLDGYFIIEDGELSDTESKIKYCPFCKSEIKHPIEENQNSKSVSHE